jgi:nicotinamide-nucleotide amidase
MTAEILSVGSELLLGEITDTNATFICQRLAGIGVSVFRRTTVGDNLARLSEAIREALARSDAVVIAGGLGPTNDDLTREAIAHAVGVALVTDEAAQQALAELYRIRGMPLSDSALRQAMIPAGSAALPNTRGSAAGVWVESNGKLIAAVPGVPSEMRAMVEQQVLPRLAAKVGEGRIILSREVHLCGIGESRAAEMVADLMQGQNPTVAPLAGTGRVTLRITARADSRQAAEAMVSEAEGGIRAALGDFVFGIDQDTLEAVIGSLLRAAGATLSVAESCTGGWLGRRFTEVPGSSDYFLGGVVAYSNQVKTSLLQVLPPTLQQYGAVSPETAREMAAGGRSLFSSTYALATTGIAGPGGATPDKPVGLVYVCLATPEDTQVEEHRFGGHREDVRWRTTQRALEMLWRRLR